MKMYEYDNIDTDINENKIIIAMTIMKLVQLQISQKSSIWISISLDQSKFYSCRRFYSLLQMIFLFYGVCK